MKTYKTAESVSVGHPDSYTDYIVNSILDAYLKQDPHARVAIDGLSKGRTVTLGGEITSTAAVDIESIVKQCTKDIGYTYEPEVVLHIYEQSPEIALGTNDETAGAGDQGTITGYACNDNSTMIPLEKALADTIMRSMYMYLFKLEQTEGIRPDMKCQVTLSYEAGDSYPQVDTVIIACQHSEDLSRAELTDILVPLCENAFESFDIEESQYNECKYIINGTGLFTNGGPEVDSGEVGRKIVVDSYGVSVPVGGGTYNGKDCTKVDRSAAYMARYVAKNIVAANLANECLITVSYCIGHKDPISIEFDFKNTEKVPAYIIKDAVLSLVSFRPADIIDKLSLRQPIFATAGIIGHFGQILKEGLDGSTISVPWEQTDLVSELSGRVNSLLEQDREED